MRHARLILLGLLGLALSVSACSSSKPSKDDGTFYLGAFEDLDESEYEDVVPPAPDSESGHVIPDGLETAEGPRESRYGRGYRVQLFASRDKREANVEHQRAHDWWESNRDGEPPLYLEWEQPYYKVRLGNYRTREDAGVDADRMARLFQGAFVVPARIELR